MNNISKELFGKVAKSVLDELAALRNQIATLTAERDVATALLREYRDEHKAALALVASDEIDEIGGEIVDIWRSRVIAIQVIEDIRQSKSEAENI